MKPSVVILVKEPVKQLNDQTGLIACDSVLAAKLVADGSAEYHRAEPTYETKVMTAKKPKKGKQ